MWGWYDNFSLLLRKSSQKFFDKCVVCVLAWLSLQIGLVLRAVLRVTRKCAQQKAF